MSVRGSLRTMSIEDILSWLSRRLIRGTLTLENAVVARSFVCDSGYITNTSSNHAREELGQMLLDAGLVDAESLKEARLVQADTGVPLSRILIMVGKIDEERLRAVLEEKSLEAMLDVFTWEDGTFAVERTEEVLAASDPAIALQLRVCIEEGRKRAARWREIRERLPSDDIVLRIVDGAELAVAGAGESSRGMAGLLTCIAQGMSIKEIASELGQPLIRVLEHLLVLLDGGHVALPLAMSPDVDAETLLAESRRLISEGDRVGAFELAARAGAGARESGRAGARPRGRAGAVCRALARAPGELPRAQAPHRPQRARAARSLGDRAPPGRAGRRPLGPAILDESFVPA
jgi:hypothetical protein